MEEKMYEYEAVCDDNFSRFKDDCWKLCIKGWKPCGGISVVVYQGELNFSQSFYKEVED